jgi:hypothetical protein
MQQSIKIKDEDQPTGLKNKIHFFAAWKEQFTDKYIWRLNIK